MEKAEELQLLGALVIVREALGILRGSSRTIILWVLALTLLLPIFCTTLGHNFIFCPDLLFKTNEKPMDVIILACRRRDFSSAWREVLVVVAAYVAFVFGMWMLARLAGLLSRVVNADVPRVWKRLMSTFVWFFRFSFGFLTACLSALILLVNLHSFSIFFPAEGGEADHKLKSGAHQPLLFGVILVVVVVFSLQMYMSTVWYLARVVSVLEDKYYGLRAMRQSSDVIKEKRMTALALVIREIISGGVIGGLLVYAVVEGRIHGVGIEARAVYGTLLVGLLCFVTVMGMLLQSVLYFEGKSYHHEIMDDVTCFKVHNVSDYELMKTSSNQLKQLHADV